MVYVPNSLSMNAVNFQKAKSAPIAIAKNISPKPVQVNKKTVPESTMRAMLKDAQAQGVNPDEIVQGLLDKGYDIEEPKTGMQKVLQVGKDVVGGIAGGLPALGTTVVGGAMKGLGTPVFEGYQKAQGEQIQPNILQRGGQELMNRGEQARGIVEQGMGARPDATGTQIGRMAVPFLASAIASGPLGLTKAGIGAYDTVKAGLASRSIPTVLKGIAGSSAVGGAEQAVYDIASKGKVEPQNVAIASAVGGGIAGLPVLKKAVSDIGGGIYNLAFKQAQQKYLNQAANNFGQNAGTLVAKEGLDAWSLKGASREIKSKLSTTREALQSQASKAGDIDANVLNTTLKTDLKGKMLKGIQEGTEFYKATSDNIDDLVDFYIGKKGTLKGDKVIDLVKELNTQLPAGAFKKSELALSKAKTSTLIKGFKNGLQSYLDKEVGDITKLYGDYSRQKLISDILNDVQVKKMLGRSLLGATVGGVGAGGGDIANGDIGSGLKKAVIGALFGGLITRTSTDPAFLYKVGRLLR